MSVAILSMDVGLNFFIRDYRYMKIKRAVFLKNLQTIKRKKKQKSAAYRKKVEKSK